MKKKKQGKKSKNAKKVQIKPTSLAQYHHVQFLKRLEKQALLSYKLVMRHIIDDLKATLRGDQLMKSDDPTKLDAGWTGDVPKIEIDLEGKMTNVIEKYLGGLKWTLLGDYAGEEAYKSAKLIGLPGRIVPGMLQSAYLQSIDAHRTHYSDIFGTISPEIPKDLMQASLEEIASHTNRFLTQTLNQIQFDLIEALDKAVKVANYSSDIAVMKEAHNLLPRDGAEDAVAAAADKALGKINSTILNKELKNVSDKFEKKWDNTVRTDLATASGVGTHQALIEIHGAEDDDVRVYWIEMEDERVCQFCKNASKNADGTFKIYKLKDFKPSGYNYGRKRKDWVLTIPGAHINCRCQLVYSPRGFEMDRNGILKAVN